MTLAHSRHGRTRRTSDAQRQLWLIFRGITVLQQMDTPVFHHEAGHLAFVLKAAAARARHARRATTLHAEADALAEELLRRFPALPLEHEDAE